MTPSRSFSGKLLLPLASAVLLSIYCVRIVRVYCSERAGQNADQPSTVVAELERAMRFDPGNAEFPHQLGVTLTLAGQDSGTAISSLRSAVALDPYSGRYWLDLAAAYQEAGDIQRQDDAVRSAITAEPGSPEVAAESAQYYLVSGETALALPLVRAALERNPDVAPTLLFTCWRATHDADLLLSQAIPPQPELQIALLRILTEQKGKAAAAEAWRLIVAGGKAFPPEISLFYFEYLLKERDSAGFDKAWHELATLAPSIGAYLPSDNLIVNAGFEQPVLNYGFDWRHQAAAHVAAGLDETVSHSGARSLSLAYDGDAAYEAGWTQYIPVQAGAPYDFSAWVKNEDMTSSSGPRIAIVDAYTDATLLLTDDVLDTHPWRQIGGQFQAPAGTDMVAIKITRAPANTKIKGRMWIDDLRLTRRP